MKWIRTPGYTSVTPWAACKDCGRILADDGVRSADSHKTFAGTVVLPSSVDRLSTVTYRRLPCLSVAIVARVCIRDCCGILFVTCCLGTIPWALVLHRLHEYRLGMRSRRIVSGVD